MYALRIFLSLLALRSQKVQHKAAPDVNRSFGYMIPLRGVCRLDLGRPTIQFPYGFLAGP